MPFLVFSYVKLWRNMKNVQCILLLKLSRRKNPLKQQTQSTQPRRCCAESRTASGCGRKLGSPRMDPGIRDHLIASPDHPDLIWDFLDLLGLVYSLEIAWCTPMSVEVFQKQWEPEVSEKSLVCNRATFFHLLLYVLSHYFALWVCLQVAQHEACNTGMYACWHLPSSTSNYRIFFYMEMHRDTVIHDSQILGLWIALSLRNPSMSPFHLPTSNLEARDRLQTVFVQNVRFQSLLKTI